MKVVKGQKGYINYLKKKDIIFIVVVAALSIGIYACGMYIYKTRANIATVFAILSLLPACKRVVNLLVLLPFRQIKSEDLSRIEAIVPENVVALVDPVFSSESHLMKFEHLTVTNNGLYAFSKMDKAKNDHAKEYLSEGIKKRMLSGNVKIYLTIGDYEHFIKTIDKEAEFIAEDLKDYFRSLMM